MKEHQKFRGNAFLAQKKKEYNRPVLTDLGKVSELTTGGSVKVQETGQGVNGAKPNGISNGPRP